MPTTVTSTIRASGGDYTSLSAWEAASQGDLVTADEVRVAECYNDWPGGLNDQLDLSGSTTDATRYREVTVADGHRHDGTSGTGFKLISAQTAWSGTAIVDEHNARLSWLEIENTTNSTSAPVVISNKNSGRLHGILAVGAGSTAIINIGSSYYWKITSCLVHGPSGASGVQSNTGFRVIEVVGCTFTTGTGLDIEDPANDSSTDHITIKNCAFFGSAVAPGITQPQRIDPARVHHNATTAGSAPSWGADWVTGLTSADVVDSAGDDYTPASGSLLLDAGADVSGTHPEAATDLIGTSRPEGAGWDIGAIERVSAGGGGFTATLAGSTGAASTSASVVRGSVTASIVGSTGAASTSAADAIMGSWSASIPGSLSFLSTDIGSISSGGSFVASLVGFFAVASTAVSGPILGPYTATLTGSTASALTSTSAIERGAFTASLAGATAATSTTAGDVVRGDFAASVSGSTGAVSTAVADVLRSAFTASLAGSTVAALTDIGSLSAGGSFTASLPGSIATASTAASGVVRGPLVASLAGSTAVAATSATAVRGSYAASLAGSTVSALTDIGAISAGGQFIASLDGSTAGASTGVGAPVFGSVVLSLSGSSATASTTAASTIMGGYAASLAGSTASGSTDVGALEWGAFTASLTGSTAVATTGVGAIDSGAYKLILKTTMTPGLSNSGAITPALIINGD